METSMRADDSAPQSVEQQLLPRREQLRTWAGHGTGAVCNGCGIPIRAPDIEYEVEMPAGSSAPALHFHFTCYTNWTGRGVR